MKKTILMFAAAGLMIATPSCKKGENDPFMSLSSRKARISNEWVVSSMASDYTWNDGTGDSSVGNTSFDGSTVTDTYTYTTAGVAGAPSVSTHAVQDASVTINKDGTYTRNWNATYVYVTDLGGGDVHTDTEVSTMMETGTWSFIGSAKGEYKNKERVVFNATTVTSTSKTDGVTNISGTSTTTTGDLYTDVDNYSTGDVSTIYDIDQLKGKEMILTQVGDGSNNWTQAGGGVSVSTTDTYTSMSTMTLTEK